MSGGSNLSLRKSLCGLHASLCPKDNKRYWVVTCLSTVCQSWRLRQRARRSVSFSLSFVCQSYEQSVTRYLFMCRGSIYRCWCRCPSFTSAIHVRKGKSDSPTGVVSFAQKSWRGPFFLCAFVDDARLATWVTWKWSRHRRSNFLVWCLVLRRRTYKMKNKSPFKRS